MTELSYRLPDSDAPSLLAELRARGYDVRQRKKRLAAKGQTLVIDVDEADVQSVRALVRGLAAGAEQLG